MNPEQQNQQPTQEKTENKPPIKRRLSENIRLSLIVAIVLLISSIPYFVYLAWNSKQKQQTPVDNVVPVSIAPSALSPSPNADETANWQIYRSDEFGFEVKYPPTWLFNPHVEYGEIPSLHIDISNFQADDAPGCEAGYIGLEIQIGGGRKYGRKGEDFETFVHSYVQTERELGMPSGKIDKMQTTNYVGFKIEDSGWDSGCKGPGYLIDQGQQRYVYVFTGRQDVKDQIYIDQILSTFRFVE